MCEIIEFMTHMKRVFSWIPDSPTWLIAKGKLDEARKNMEEAAAMNIETQENGTKANRWVYFKRS